MPRSARCLPCRHSTLVASSGQSAPSLGRGCWLSERSAHNVHSGCGSALRSTPATSTSGSYIAIGPSLPDPGERMKVTIDTRHDSLDEALATVRAAFGPSGTSSSGGEHTAKRAQPAGSAAARPLAKRLPTRRAAPTKKASTKNASGRNERKRTAPTDRTSNIAPRGQADAIRAWAKSQGMQVKQAGRLPAVVIQAYQESTHS